MTKRTTYRQVLNLSSNICPFSSDMVTLRFLFKEACYSQIKSDDINKVPTIERLAFELKGEGKVRSWKFDFQILRNIFFMNFINV